MFKRLLVTGGAGFIGSNFITYFLSKYPNVLVVNLDKLTYAGSMDNLSEVSSRDNFVHVTGDICDESLVNALFEQYDFDAVVHFAAESHVDNSVTEVSSRDNFVHVTGDICDESLVNALFEQYDFDAVVHFAAESHVDNSVTGPKAFVQTNVVGTFTLLQAALKHWMDGPHQVKSGKEHCRFHHISTDEVYGALGESGSFTEDTAYAPNSPYSATKASSDFLIRAYHHTYGLNVTTSNCSNNYGPRQHVEKLIPKTISCILNHHAIPVYGTGLNVRDWLFVEDHCSAIDTILREGKSGETYNVGTNNELDNMTLIKAICALMDKKVPAKDGQSYTSLITHVKDRPGHDFRYAVDTSKLKEHTSWRPKYNFEGALEYTIDWYIKKLSD